MKNIIAIALVTLSVNAFADNYGMTSTQQSQQDMQNTSDSPNGYACDPGQKC